MTISVIGVLIAVLFLCILIVGHEFGHFISAKLLGVKVLEFSMGMGPLLWKKQKGETQYSLRAVPIGGFCKLEGEDGDEDKTDPRSFSNQPAWSKILILVMGSVMNIILGIIIISTIYLYAGSASTYIESVSPGSPAQEAGILAGDKVVSIDGKDIRKWSDVTVTVDAYGGAEPLDIVLERKGANGKQQVTAQLVPEFNDEVGRYLMGITSKIVHSVPLSIKSAMADCGNMIVSMKDFLVNLFRGRTSSDDVVGVVGIMAVVSEQAKTNGLLNVVYLMGIIGYNLAIVNMLPFPALDGGRILFVILRKITNGRISDKAEGIVNGIGFILLMILMVFLIFKDVFRLLF